MPNAWRRRRLDTAHLLAVIAIVLAIVAPAGAALVNAKGLATNAVESRHIKNGQVRTADIGAKAVTEKQLAAGAVTAPSLGTGAVGTVQVADASLTGTDLVDGSVTAVDLAPGTVGASALAAGSISSSLLADGSVTASKLVASSVSSATIADATITSADIATGAITSAKIATGAIGEAEIGPGAVDSIELADGSVTTIKLADGSVSGAKLGAVVGAGLTAVDVAVAQDGLDAPPAEDNDGTVVGFDTELWDTAAMWALGSPTNIVLPSDGLYQAETWVYWQSNTSGTREAQIVHDGAIVAQDRRLAGSGVGGLMNQTIVATFDGNAGDIVRVRLSQNATATLDADTVRMTIRRVGTIA
jgi:hypothetical protein